MKTNKYDQITAKLLELPPIAWPQRLKAIADAGKTDMDGLRKSMDDNAERLAFLSEYISCRFGCNGCGEKTPQDAVKRAQRRQKKVTKALGFFPDLRRPFFSASTASEV